ncbi:MAG: hypothetical protein QG602_3003, partial [Verrucomicrobiota bacterium]|nr:hypothetical protein [Verrucomicrobiota bacterium]
MSVEPEPPEPPSLPVQDAVAADQAAAHTTESHDHHGPFHTHCENCGTKLEGPWCHKCGQHDFEFHRSFWHVFMEALETLFHFEGKFFRNIVTLLFRPGVLTADFNAGKRATQMPPFRLYIFVSFIFFLLIFLGEKEDNFVRETKGKPHQGFSIDGAPVVLGLDDPASPEKEHTPTPGEPRLVDQVRTLAEQVQTGQTETLKKNKQGKPAGEASA